MSLPQTKQELADWILRRLGAPVVNVEIADEQLEDAIDEAVQFFQEYHYDGAERTYRAIQLTSDILDGNNRRSQDATAPAYDVTLTDEYRISDKVMTFKQDGTPDKIWVKYDSETRLYQYNFLDSDNGLFFHPATSVDTEFFITTDAAKYLDSDFVVLDSDLGYYRPNTNVVSDSDGGFVLYDSDQHTIFVYDVDSDNGDWVDSEGSFTLYDSDSHTFFRFDSDSNGIWIDSEGEFVTYDSDKHTFFRFDSDVNGVWVDSEGEFVSYDSDKHSAFVYHSDIGGEFFDSEGQFVVFDSDKHSFLNWFVIDSDTSSFSPFDSEVEKYFFKTEDSEFVSVKDGLDKILSFPKLPNQMISPKVSNLSPTYLEVNGSKIAIAPEIRNFELRGSTETAVDSDGYGSPLGFIALDGYRINFKIYAGFIETEVYKIDSDLYSDSDNGLPNGIVRVYKSAEDSDTDSDIILTEGVFARTWIDNTIDLYSNEVTLKNEKRFRRETVQQTRFTRSTDTLQTFTKSTEMFIRYSRHSVVNGKRYDRVVVKEYPKTYAFYDLWKEERSVLLEPYLNLDYSRTGQIGIPIPEDIIGITKVMRIDNFSGIGMWNYEYQYFLTNFDFFYGNGGSSSMPLSNYYIQKSYIDLIDNMMNVQPAIRFNKVRNRLYIDTNWTRLEKSATNRNYHLMIECYEVNDPELYGDVYKDKWLKRYATALAKVQWGTNLKKYSNTELPGGLTVDGQAMYEEAWQEKEKLEEELKSSGLEMDFFIG